MRDREAATLTGAALLAALWFAGGPLLASGALAALGCGWRPGGGLPSPSWSSSPPVRSRCVDGGGPAERVCSAKGKNVKSFLGRFGHRSACRAAASLAQSLPHVFMGYPVDFGAGDGLHSRRSDTCSPARGARFRALDHRLVVARS